jgi:uridylate kinase
MEANREMAVTRTFRRVLVKLSGEALMAPDGYWLDTQTLAGLAEDIAAATRNGFEIALVIGGGNIIRGARMSAAGWIDRPTADAMGMLGTVMNSLALETALNAAGVTARTMSAVSMPTICETYARQPALHHLDKGQVIVLAGGTGNPFFTTDTSAVLRAAELRCDAVLKATQVDGVYSADPKKGSFRDPLRQAHPRRGHRQGPQGHGHRSLRAGAGEQAPDHRGERAQAEFGGRDPRRVGAVHHRRPLKHGRRRRKPVIEAFSRPATRPGREKMQAERLLSGGIPVRVRDKQRWP